MQRQNFDVNVQLSIFNQKPPTNFYVGDSKFFINFV